MCFFNGAVTRRREGSFLSESRPPLRCIACASRSHRPCRLLPCRRQGLRLLMSPSPAKALRRRPEPSNSGYLPPAPGAHLARDPAPSSSRRPVLAAAAHRKASGLRRSFSPPKRSHSTGACLSPVPARRCLPLTPAQDALQCLLPLTPTLTALHCQTPSDSYHRQQGPPCQGPSSLVPTQASPPCSSLRHSLQGTTSSL
ncbi:Dynamin-3 [Manis pentadactyla]|nr:Dynamin-3 [Manis pentadactyla]